MLTLSGWKGGMEMIVFSAIDKQMKGHLVAEDFKFVERERKKIQRKEATADF